MLDLIARKALELFFAIMKFLTANSENAREKTANAIELFYWALIFEGALRKWFLSPLQSPLYFLRDPIALWIYYVAWRFNLFPRNRLFSSALVMMGIFTILGFLQFSLGKCAPEPILYGWRMYFYFIPLAFVGQEVLTAKHLKQIVRRTLLVSVPMAVLVFLQYMSPVNSPINKLLEADSAAFQYGGVARASGTFSFTQGHMYFCVTAFVLLLSAWQLSGKNRPLPLTPMIICTVGVIVNILLDGNRGVLLQSFFVLIFSLIYRVFISKAKIGFRSFLPELLVVISGLIYVAAFPAAFEAMSARTQGNREEGQARAISSIQGPLRAIETLPSCTALGTGLGSGTSGGHNLAMRSPFRMFYREIPAEEEMPRIVQECGPIGLLFILFRTGLVVYLLYQSWKVSARAQTCLPILVTSYLAIMLLEGQISFNGTANGYAWLFLAIALASFKLGPATPNVRQ